MKMEPIVSSETSAIRTQTPGNYPKRNKLLSLLGLENAWFKSHLGLRKPCNFSWLSLVSPGKFLAVALNCAASRVHSGSLYMVCGCYCSNNVKFFCLLGCNCMGRHSVPSHTVNYTHAPLCTVQYTHAPRAEYAAITPTTSMSTDTIEPLL